MAQYPIHWKDYRLPTGEEFAVAVCGYSGKVRHLTIGQDPLRHMLASHVDVDGQGCSSAKHCLSLNCPLNHSENYHLMHMLDMYKDEPVDEATAELWGKKTTIDCLVEMARRISDSLAAETLPNKATKGSDAG